VTRYYSLVMFEKTDSLDLENQRSDFEGLASDFEGIESEGQRSDFEGRTSDFEGRTWKDNKKKDNKKKKNQNSLSVPKGPDRTSEVPSLSGEDQDATSSSPESNGSSRRGKKKQPSPFDIKAASKFAEVVRSHRKVQKNSDLRQWANTFRQMRETDKVPEKDIRETITWYRKHIGEDYMPEAFSAAAFRKKYAEGKFASAMKRCLQNNGTSSNGRKRLTRENMWNDSENMLPGGILKVEVGYDGREYDGRLLYQIRRRVLERFGQGLPMPEELQAVLDEEFPDVKDLSVSTIGRVG